jgi:hypothetical protein
VPRRRSLRARRARVPRQCLPALPFRSWCLPARSLTLSLTNRTRCRSLTESPLRGGHLQAGGRASVRSLRMYGSSIGLPSQLRPVLDHNAAAAARPFPHSQASDGPACRVSAHGDRPSRRHAPRSAGLSWPSRRAHGAGSLASRCTLIGCALSTPVLRSWAARGRLAKRGAAEGPGPANVTASRLRRGRGGSPVCAPGPNRRRCPVEGPTFRVALGCPRFSFTLAGKAAITTTP